MGKWTEIAKTLPRRQEEESPFRLKVNAHKESARRNGIAGVEPVKAAYRVARSKKEELEARVSELNAEILACEELLADDATATGRETPYYYEDGARVEVNPSVAFSVEDAEKLMAWVRTNKLERLLSLNAQTRDSIARQRLESGEALPDGVKASAYSAVRFVKPKK